MTRGTKPRKAATCRRSQGRGRRLGGTGAAEDRQENERLHGFQVEYQTGQGRQEHSQGEDLGQAMDQAGAPAELPCQGQSHE